MRDMETVVSALAAHATRAAEKLRQHGLVAGTMTVFYHTSRFSAGKPQHAAPRTVRLTPMSPDYVPALARFPEIQLVFQILSCQVGCMKPDQAIYDHVIQAAGVAVARTRSGSPDACGR